MSKDLRNPFADIRSAPKNDESNQGPRDMPKRQNLFNKMSEGVQNWKQDADFRMKICNTCPDYAAPRCKLCGCFMVAKTKIPQAKCPAGKW